MSSASATIDLRFEAEDSAQALVCRYRREPAKAQARFKNRAVLQPDIDLKLYRVAAVCDYVELVVDLARATQFRYVQEALEPVIGRQYVAPVDEGSGGAASRFRIRIQDPGPGQLTKAMNVLVSKYGMGSAGTRLNELEACVDFYPSSGSAEDRRRMVGVMQRHFLPRLIIDSVDEAQRRKRALQGRGLALRKKLNLRQQLGPKNTRVVGTERGPISLDGTYYVAPKGDPLYWRIQDKVSNKRKGADATPLAPTERRARIEVTLKREALAELGLGTVDDLLGFKFETLARRHFSFWLPTVRRHSEMIEDGKMGSSTAMFLEWGTLGCLIEDYDMNAPSRQLARARGRSPRPVGATGNLMAWDDLNRVVKRALRKLHV